MKPTKYNPMLVRAANTETFLLFRAPSGGIPARSGTTLGSATCDVFDQALADTNRDITIHNWSRSVICDTGNRYGFAIKYRGRWFAIAEDCSDT